MNSSPLLQLNHLAFERDDRLLFSDISACVVPGDIWQVSGANGSGKTTLLKVITGLLVPASGQCLWGDCQSNHKPSHDAAYNGSHRHNVEVLYIGHQAGIKSTLTAEENLHWLQQLHSPAGAGQPAMSIQQALQRVGLQGYEDVPCHSLSAGQQRRVALARLYLSSAQLWILDEPFTAIDRQGVAELEQVFEQHTQRGGAVILTTHQPLNISGVKTLNLDTKQTVVVE